MRSAVRHLLKRMGSELQSIGGSRELLALAAKEGSSRTASLIGVAPNGHNYSANAILNVLIS